MDDEAKAILNRLEEAQRRQEKTLSTLESRISIIHDGMRSALEGVSRLKLQMQNAKMRSQTQSALLEKLATGIERLQSALQGGASQGAATSEMSAGPAGESGERDK